MSGAGGGARRRAVLVASVLLAGAGSACVPLRTGPRGGAARRVLPAAVILPVRGHAQRHALSCESRSAVDLLAAYGIEVEEDSFLEGLPRSENPERGFVGDVDGPAGRLPPDGYGVYEGPIAQRIRYFGLEAEAVRGRDLDWLRGRLAEGRPSIVWATAGLEPATPRRLQTSYGETFTAVLYEHTYLLVGYRRGSVLLVDAGTGERTEEDEARFEGAWAALGRRAVVPRDPLGTPRSVGSERRSRRTPCALDRHAAPCATCSGGREDAQNP